MSLKNRDQKNRWRNKTVAFRVSPEEWEQVETFARLSGLNKQDYLIARVLQKDVVVNGNPRVFKALRNQLTNISFELSKLQTVSPENAELFEIIRFTDEILNGLKEEQ